MDARYAPPATDRLHSNLGSQSQAMTTTNITVTLTVEQQKKEISTIELAETLPATFTM